MATIEVDKYSQLGGWVEVEIVTGDVAVSVKLSIEDAEELRDKLNAELA